MNKKGVSAVITTVLIILISIVAIFIIWGFISGFLFGARGSFNTKDLTTRLSVESAGLSEETLTINVKHLSGEDVSGLRVLIYDADGNIESRDVDDSAMTALQQKSLLISTLDLIGLTGDPVKVEVFPIFTDENGKVIIGQTGVMRLIGCDPVLGCSIKLEALQDIGVSEDHVGIRQSEIQIMFELSAIQNVGEITKSEACFYIENVIGAPNENVEVSYIEADWAEGIVQAVYNSQTEEIPRSKTWSSVVDGEETCVDVMDQVNVALERVADDRITLRFSDPDNVVQSVNLDPTDELTLDIGGMFVPDQDFLTFNSREATENKPYLIVYYK
ncbi:hypothetical protein CMI45_01895 [Candidatus Pacearchaeota archaeon]|jgi:hypothetical protein|nr:hypothetical protein [Candidatus Pacearchaeota archaeon]|tara:strand:+ start:1545 stop:2537 length:993 start_codon:yes stop_codon:yes gene_type:complete